MAYGFVCAIRLIQVIGDQRLGLVSEICAPHRASDYVRKCSVELCFVHMVHCFIVDLSIMEMCPVSVCIDGISLY
jgi:hypothetical protein